jgi:hypothetical protein
MQHLNLLDARLLPPKRWLTASIIVPVVAAAIGATFLHAVHVRDDLRLVLLSGSAPVDSPTEIEPSAEHRALQTRHAQTQALVKALSQTTALPDRPADTLRRLIQALPEQAWLSEVEIGPQGSLKVSGGILDSTQLPRYAQSLALSAGVQGRPVEVLRLRPRETGAEASDAQSAQATRALPAQLFTLATAGAGETPP